VDEPRVICIMKSLALQNCSAVVQLEAAVNYLKSEFSYGGFALFDISFVAAFAKLRKAAVSFVMFVCLFVHPCVCLSVLME
jgi:hypothetical protein